MPADKEIFELYSGKVRLEYTDKTHRYRASVEGGKFEHCPSVTTILNVLAKPALIEWGIKCACNYVEENLKQLVSGDSFSVQQVFKVIEQARTAHDRVREDAAEVGTNVHDMLATFWHSRMTGAQFIFDPIDDRVRRCYEAALLWFAEHELKPVRVEKAQYSQIIKMCGRPDWIGYIDGKFSVLDYKSTKNLYPEVALQMTAYGMMHAEEFGELPATRWGLRLDKEYGEFEARCYKPETFDEDQETFLACFKIYDRLKHLRRKPKPEPKEDFLAQL